MLISTKKLLFLLLIPLSTAEQCTSMQARKSLMKQSAGTPKKNTITDTELKSLQNLSQGNVAPKMKVQPVVELPKDKPTFAQEQTNIDQPMYDQLDPANSEGDRSKSNIDRQDKGKNQNEQPTKKPKKKGLMKRLSNWLFAIQNK